MEAILEPLKVASRTGEEMLCADGGVRRVYPILAAYIADFQEQSTVTCVQQSRCPICWVPNDERGDISVEYPLRGRRQTLDALEDHWEGYSATIEVLGIRPTRPFWADLPYADISNCVAPDILHQLHKGVFGDHVVKWCTAILGAKEVDRRTKGMPRFQKLRHFARGVSPLSQWTGTESKALGSVFLPVLSGCEGEVVTAARSVIDFMYRAHLPELSEDDLDAMDRNLQTFHSVKHIFVDPETRNLPSHEDRFNDIPKIHMLSHYTRTIRELGTPDGYNTEATERLHIDYVKVAWRASNHVNATQQMATYLQRKESWVLLRAYLHDTGQLVDPRFDPVDSEGETEEEEEEENTPEVEESDEDDMWSPAPAIMIAKRPAFARRTGTALINTHKATDLIRATRRFLAPNAPPGSILPLSEHTAFRVWTRCKLRHKRLPFLPSFDPPTDQVRAHPGSLDDEGRRVHAESFDVVLFSPPGEDVSGACGVHRYRAGRVRAIFELPLHLQFLYPSKLVYVERFQPFSMSAPQPLSLYTTTHMMRDNRRCASVIPLSHVRMACHLAPRYHLLDPDLPISASTDLLSAHNSFLLNKYASFFLFIVFEYWQKCRSNRPRCD
ncbi:hypothetical protein FRC06_010865 [Ceratobasidium sp. 370]|nr:hypothetical protein FRC06_010865 [Ceratobasidium sp. 370]